MAFEIVHTFIIDPFIYDIQVDFSRGIIQLFRRNHAPPPPGEVTQAELGYNEGDTIRQRCEGTTLKKVTASFTYPYAVFVIEVNSAVCNYIPPICAIDLTATPQNATDNQANGKILISGSGATEYSLNGIVWQSSPIFDLLFPGTYHVYGRNSTCQKGDVATVGNDISAIPISTELIPYQDSKNLCFWFRLIIDGIIYPVREPIKWDTVNIIGKRNMDYHGYQFQYSDGAIDLGFDCPAGKELIEAVYNARGQDGTILFQYGYTYKGKEYFLFPGKLNLNTYKWYAERVECSIETDDFDSTFQSRLETKVSMAQGLTFDNLPVTPPAPYSLLFHAKEILSEILCSKPDKTFDTTAPITGKFYFLLADNTEPQISDIEEAFTYPLNVTLSNPIETDQYLINFKRSGGTDVELTWNLDVDMHVHNHGIAFGTDYVIGVHYVYRKINTDGSFDDIIEPLITPITGHVAADSDPVISFNLTASKTLTDFYFYEKDQIYFYADIAFDRTVDIGFHLHQNSFTENIYHREVTKATNANVWLLDDVIKQTINVITNNRYAFRSSYFERKGATQLADGCGAKRAVVNGFQIRQFDTAEKPLVIDLKTIVESLNAGDCIGINYSSSKNTPIVRMERRDFFYQQKQIIAIPEIEFVEGMALYREEVAKEIIYNEIEIGYDKYASEGFNTLDEFNTKHEELTPIKKNAAKLVQQSHFITSGYSIEEIRREQFNVTPSSSVSNDDEPFMVCLKRNPDDSFATEKNEPFESVLNLISPETAYNLRISPARMLYNWFIWLKGIFAYKPLTDLIKTTFVVQNGLLTTRFNISELCLVGDMDRTIITEKADIPLSKLATTRDIYRPEWVYFTARLTPDRVQIMNLALSGKFGVDKDYGYIMVKKPTGEWQGGWVYNLSYNYWTEKAEIKMLKMFKTPLLEDDTCCKWLVANDCYILANDCDILMDINCQTDFVCVAAAIIGNPSLPDGVIGVPYDFTVHLDGTAPFDITNRELLGTWMQIDIDGNAVRFHGTPNNTATNVEVGFSGFNCDGANFLPFFDTISIFGPSTTLAYQFSVIDIGTENKSVRIKTSINTLVTLQFNDVAGGADVQSQLSTDMIFTHSFPGQSGGSNYQRIFCDSPENITYLEFIGLRVNTMPSLLLFSSLIQLISTVSTTLNELGTLPASLQILNISSNHNLAVLPTMPISLINLYAVDCILTVSAVSTALQQLDANGQINGIINLSGQTPAAIPNAGGLTAKANLITKGWTVTTD